LVFQAAHSTLEVLDPSRYGGDAQASTFGQIVSSVFGNSIDNQTLERLSNLDLRQYSGKLDSIKGEDKKLYDGTKLYRRVHGATVTMLANDDTTLSFNIPYTKCKITDAEILFAPKV
jgi:hypothetical protein